jgi:lysophospholipase L1-like esterase
MPNKTLAALIGLMAIASCGGSGSYNSPPVASTKSITAFYLDAPWATGSIDEATHTIELAPYGADVTGLTPTIVHSGSRVTPASGMTRDFSRPVVYTVTAADGTTQGYSVSVMPPARGQLMRVSGESLVLPARQTARLSFDRLILGSVAVRSTYLSGDPARIDYREGVDYTVDYPNGTITRTAASRIPDFSFNVLYGQHDFNQKDFPGYTNHPFFVWVDYETSNGEAFAKPNDQSRYLANTRAKLEAGGPFRIVSYGDSITAGRETSTPDLTFTALYRDHLQSRYPGATIVLEDVSLPGYTSTQAIGAWDATVGTTSPDLVLLGWGMNDHSLGGASPEQFKQNLITLVAMARDLKHADVILFSAFPPNQEWHYGTHRMSLYAEATRQAAAETNCAYVDVFDTWGRVLQRKDQSSLLGNNINHPNDFGHWLYLQTFAAMGL